MQEPAFRALLASEGYTTVALIEREASGELAEHAHPFAVKALILTGDMMLRTAYSEQRFQTGDIFQLEPGEPYAETFGPQGVRYLAGRKE